MLQSWPDCLVFLQARTVGGDWLDLARRVSAIPYAAFAPYIRTTRLVTGVNRCRTREIAFPTPLRCSSRI